MLTHWINSLFLFVFLSASLCNAINFPLIQRRGVSLIGRVLGSQPRGTRIETWTLQFFLSFFSGNKFIRIMENSDHWDPPLAAVENRLPYKDEVRVAGVMSIVQIPSTQSRRNTRLIAYRTPTI